MKSYEEISREVTDIIARKLGLTTDDISHHSIISHLTRDSIQLFELLLAFEQHYKLETAYADVVQINTVGDAVKYVAQRKYGLEDA